MRIDISELINSPGQTRSVERSVTRAEAATSGADWGPGEDVLLDPIVLDLVCEGMVEGVFVHGTIGFGADIPCARCLEPVSAQHEVRIAELYRDPRQAMYDDETEDGYVIANDRESIDLEALLRDEILPAIPIRVVHEDESDCGDLWAEAGLDGGPGTTADELPDPRWAALRGLALPD